ncbi:MAG: T9SS type A sorting domain-containing protein [Saprospiraceae bacterium]|nr:T9SS type A sorting domain-containing protein [Saprospiraceae bacterium]
MVKNTSRFFLLIISIFFSISSFGQHWVEMMNDPSYNFYEVQKEFNKYWEGKEIEKGKGWKQFKRWEYFMELRVDSSGRIANPSASWKVYKTIRANQAMAKSAPSADWKFIGPSDIPTNKGGAGRLNCIEIHPNNPNIMFVGAPSGGLWKSINGGLTWLTNTDDLANIGVSDIAIDPANPNNMYLATGDGDGGDTYSIGILKSVDGGNSWDTTSFSWDVNNQRKITKILVDPTNSEKIFATTTNGIYRSLDAGSNWNLIKNGSYKDIKFMPGNTSVIYISTSQSILKSTNGGDDFTALNFGGGTLLLNRLMLAVTPADPNYLYVVGGRSSDNGFGGLWLSVDTGNSFVLKSTTPNLLGWSTTGSDNGGQSWYDLAIAASPTNKNIVYVGGVNIWKSSNKGQNWSQVGHWTGADGNPYVHADIHSLEFSPANPNTLFACTDGGLFITTNNGYSWTDRSNGLEIAQIYGMGISATQPNIIMTGWQDNGSNYLNGSTWKRVIGGDGMKCQIDYSDNDIMYGSLYYGRFKISTNGGAKWKDIYKDISETGNWVTPFEIHPTNPQTIFMGYTNLWKSTNRGDDWNSISNLGGSTKINAIGISPSNPDYIYVAKSTLLYRTTNGGSTWTNVSNGLSSGTITSIVVHETDFKKVWVTKSGYYDGVKVFYSDKGGVGWTNVSGSLPNIPVNCIAYENGSDEALYVGTDVGVYYKDSTMTDWIPFMDYLPNVIVNELEFFYPENKIIAATYGRGVWESYTYSALQTSLKEKAYKINEIVVYPNPTNKEINILLTEELHGETKISIYNSLGQLVHSEKTKSFNSLYKIDMQNKPSGFYYIEVKNKNKQFSSKFIKE